MKLVLYTSGHRPHHKNWASIQRMCKSCDIEFEYTNNRERIKTSNYDILYCTSDYVDPTVIPSEIKIIYGPHFWVIPSGPVVGNYNPIFEGRWVFNSLSKWVGDFYLELAKEFTLPIAYFPFGVDTERFKPTYAEKTQDCLVYIKHRSEVFISNILKILYTKNIVYKTIKYGSYSEDQYISELQKSKFMVVLDAHESQGFALEEAMSADVPLLVIDATSMYDEIGSDGKSTYAHLRPKNLFATSVPYWSDECGIKITKETELEDALDRMLCSYTSYNPRDYIIDTLSDKVCMERILDYFKLK